MLALSQKIAFNRDPLEYWGLCEEAFADGKDGSAALAAAEKNRGLKAQQLLECVSDYWGIGAWDEVIALCDAALAKAAVEKPYETEGALPLKETLAACDSYKNALFGYFKAYAQAKKLNLPAAERLALMEKYRSTVHKYDPCVLRLAYTYNAVGRYTEAHEILTTRRFHVWEGADGLLAPFVESCLGLGRGLMEKGDYKMALKYFEESTTYPSNLQAGRPGDAGTEPKSRYFMAQCKKALGDQAGYRAELGNSLKGWIHAGEMDYWRVKALRELGRDGETAPLIAELKQAIKELETPQPEVINAYAKYAGDNSAMERAAKAREKADALRKLLEEIEK